ncbi:MAG: HIG1 domain-containing protein [Paracoccus sp. (in: a-proteobacteria)]
MSANPVFYLIPLGLLVVTVILTVGIGGFGLGGAFNRHNGNRLMRLRIIAQAGVIALLLILALIYR